MRGEEGQGELPVTSAPPPKKTCLPLAILCKRERAGAQSKTPVHTALIFFIMPRSNQLLLFLLVLLLLFSSSISAPVLALGSDSRRSQGDFLAL